jgi:predicted AlkP superfamily phosphohydrolase/phosphomutase/tetratricopeptide (TPR) repeat protein
MKKRTRIMAKKKVLVIGWDAADWQIINPLMEKGLMPTLKGFLNESAYGNIATLDPPYSPMLWTSIATGKNAYDHGVLGFTEVLPDGSGIRPISAHSRKVKAIWNILNQEGYKSNVVSWWPSNPVEDINGVMVSNFYQHARTKSDEPWPLVEGTVNKAKYRDILAELRVHPDELTAAHLEPMIPNLKGLDLEKNKVLYNSIKILAHAASVHNATTYLLEETEWDFMAVYHDAIDHMSHLAMKYRAPQLEGISDEDHENYQHLVDGMYRFHDMMLERTLNLLDDDTYVILLSDHGFRNDHTRLTKIPIGPATPAIEHRPYGVFAIKGPGIKKGEQIFGTSLLDIAPTILQLFDLPVGEDMEGNVLVNAFEKAPKTTTIASWEKVKGNDAMLTSDAQGDQEAEQAALQQLIDLGYVDKKEKSVAKRLMVTKREAQLNCARSYIHAGKKRKAIPLLEDACEEHPSKYVRLLLLSLYLDMGYLAKSAELIEICKKEYPESTNLKFYEGQFKWMKGNFVRAEQIFNELTLQRPTSDLFQQIGKLYNTVGRHEDAIKMLMKGKALENEHLLINHQLGFAYLRLGEYEKALEHFFSVVDSQYHMPKAHLFIGESLYHLGMYKNAAEALEVSAKMAPYDMTVRKWLCKIYRDELGNPEKALEHQGKLPDQEKEIVVVSGLPRSGTSMMMRMLDFAGIDALTDESRDSDESNPHGYYEHEWVRNLANDATWISKAEGKAVKIIAQLLPYLPSKYRYKVIFMEREISEVLISQQIMLGKSREEAIKTYPFKLAQTFYNQLQRVNEWVDQQPFIDILHVNYLDCHTNPEEVVKRISDFLDRELDSSKMIEAIDQSLYRNKNV